MPRRCTVCDHPNREAIDTALVRDESNRRIAAQFSLSESSVRRHKAKHLPKALVKAQGATEATRATDLMGELESCLRRINLLFDACDRWLRDVDNPEQYDIGPRAADISVTYSQDGRGGRRVRRKAKLSSLLEEVQADKARGRRRIEMVETKHADPRELILKVSARLQGQLELVAKLIGELQQEGTVNIILAPEWVEMRTVILTALVPYPDARLAVAHALGDGHAQD